MSQVTIYELLEEAFEDYQEPDWYDDTALYLRRGKDKGPIRAVSVFADKRSGRYIQYY
jgi:hypothetical protein